MNMKVLTKTTAQRALRQMKAVVINQFGGIEKLSLQTRPIPALDPDEILIHVESAGVGEWDPFEREGGFAKMFEIEPKFPYVLGTDGAGTVEAVGSRVKKFKEGDRVYALSLMNPKGGFYAEYIAVNQDNAALIPDNLPTEQAGAMPVDAITALQGLDDTLGLKPDESLLICGASGGIGHLAVQLAKGMGARVLAVASGNDGVELVARLGADAAIDGHKDDIIAAARDFAPDGLDAVLLTVGGVAAEKSIDSLRKGGRVAYPNGVEPEPKVRPGLNIQSYDGRPDPQVFDKLNNLIESGPFTVHISKVFPLDRAADAQRALVIHHLGKIALRP
jgi:NADPH2:quinone reductase